MTHELKIKNIYANRILTGEKTFEVRANDRDYQRGDFIEFKVLGKNGKNLLDHKLNGALYMITYIHTDYGMDAQLDRDTDEMIGYVILGIKPVGARGVSISNGIKKIEKAKKLSWKKMGELELKRLALKFMRERRNNGTVL